jgi:hypothetical protein
MNTKPDDTEILLWLDDELDASSAATVENWAAAHMPFHLAQRDELRAWKAKLRSALPANQEIPCSDFFQHRIIRSIEENIVHDTVAPAVVRNHQPAWKKWLLPSMGLAACAIGGFMGGRFSYQASPPLITYTPEEGVKAEFFVSSPADATVIVLNGVKPLPENFMDKETASHPVEGGQHSDQAVHTLTP